MAQLFIQFAVMFVGLEIIKNNLMEIFLPSVLLCNSLGFVMLFYPFDCNAVLLVYSPMRAAGQYFAMIYAFYLFTS